MNGRSLYDRRFERPRSGGDNPARERADRRLRGAALRSAEARLKDRRVRFAQDARLAHDTAPEVVSIEAIRRRRILDGLINEYHCAA